MNLCPVPLVCCDENSYSNSSSVCFLSRKDFNVLAPATIFNGFFFLNGEAPILNLVNVHISHIYALLNFEALFYDQSQSSNIFLTNVVFDNGFFQNGFFYLNYLSTENSYFMPSFIFQTINLTITRWNYYEVTLASNMVNLYPQMPYIPTIFAFSGVPDFCVVSFSQTILRNSNLGYFMVLLQTTVVIEDFNTTNITGSLFYQNNCSNFTLTSFQVNNVVMGSSDTIILDAIFGNIYLSDLIFANLTGLSFHLNNTVTKISNIIASNLSFPSFRSFQALFLFLEPGNNLTIDGMIINEVNDLAKALIIETMAQPYFMINNSVISNIGFRANGYYFLVLFANLTFQNSQFLQINLSQSLFQNSPSAVSNLSSNLFPILNINSMVLMNIYGGAPSPIFTIVSAVVSITFQNVLFTMISFSKSMFTLSPDAGSNVSFTNSTFLNIIIKDGFMMALSNYQTLKFSSSLISNLTFASTSNVMGIFQLNNASANISSSLFLDISFPLANGDLFGGTFAALRIEMCLFRRVNIYGTGGFTFSSNSSISISNSVFDDLSNAENGIFNIDSSKISLRSSNFSNVFSLKYTLFVFTETISVSVLKCQVRNISSTFESATFYITSSIKSSQFSIIFFNGTKFENTSALSSNGGGLFIENCVIPVIVRNCTFFSCNAESGGCIFMKNSSSIQVNNSFFSNSRAQLYGAAACFLQVKNIEFNSSSFFNNSAENGKGGNIYLEEGNFSLTYSKFTGLSTSDSTNHMQGSALYAKFDESSDVFNLFMNSSQFKNLIQDSEVISIFNLATVNTTLMNLNFSQILSLEGNGVFSCQKCNIALFLKINISNSTLSGSDGNMFDLNFESSTPLLISQLVFQGNIMVGTGSLLFVNSLDFLVIYNLTLNRNILMTTAVTVQQFNTFTLNVTQYIGTSNLNNARMIEVASGTLFSLMNILFSDSNSSFLILQCDHLQMENISISNSNNQNPDFLRFDQLLTAKLYNFTVKQSMIGSFGIDANALNIKLFRMISVSSSQDSGSYLLHFADSQFSGTLITQDIQILEMFDGILIENFATANITTLNFSNSESQSADHNQLNLNNINNLIVNNCFLQNLNTHGLFISNFQTISPSNNTINNTVFLNCGNPGVNGGGAFIIGNINILFSFVNFTDNYGSPGSAILFSSTMDLVKINFTNVTFTNSSIISLIVSGNAFYQSFQAANKALLAIPEIRFTSYGIKINVYVNYLLYNETNPIIWYSGETARIEFMIVDHFAQPSDDLNQMKIEITQNATNYTLNNSKTLFTHFKATFPEFSMIVPPKEISNQIVTLNVEVSNQENNLLPQYTLTLKLKIKSCDIAHTLISNVCVRCPDGTYSVDENPTEKTICYPCPDNCDCYSGKTLVPRPGYWNLNRNNSEVFRCQTQSACNITYINETTMNVCGIGYFGSVCQECKESYGKTLLKTCIPCDSDYKENHVLSTIFRWFILAMITIYQYSLISNRQNKGKRFLLSVLNVAIYHSSILAMLIRSQNQISDDLINFMETQRVISFFEPNLFMIYCLFPNYRSPYFAFVTFFYIMIVVFFQFCFMYIIIGIKIMIKKYKNEDKDDTEGSYLIKEAFDYFSLLVLNNFVTLFYYFIGLVFYFEVTPYRKVSIYFMEVIVKSKEYFVVLFAVFFTIFFAFCYFSWYFLKNKIKKGITLIMDAEYKEKLEKFLCLNYIVLIFVMILVQYSAIGRNWSSFIRNILMIYLGLISIFKMYKSIQVQTIKICSLIAIIVACSELDTATIILNSLFYCLIFAIILHTESKNICLVQKKILKPTSIQLEKIKIKNRKIEIAKE